MTLTEKRELVARLLREKKKEDSIHPISHVQRSLWLHHQLAPGSSAYHVAYALRIRSECNPRALRRALQALTDRHAALRTSFFRESDSILQRVRGDVAVSLEVVDAGHRNGVSLKTEVDAAVRHPFDLSEGPLFRAHLWTRVGTHGGTHAADESVLLITAHHIVMDGWSLLVLLDELRLLYRAENEGSVIGLPRVEAQYAEFVQWQKAFLARPEGERLREYWHSVLTGELPHLELPADKPRPPIQTFHGATLRFTLPGALHGNLKQFAKSQGATLFTTLLAAWFVLLHRHGGGDDIIVGCPVGGRSLPAFARTVGCFINMVAIRADLKGNPAFELLLQSTRRTVTAALAHGDYPFQLLVEELSPGRDASRAPIFQNSFILQNLQHAPGLADLFERHARDEAANFGGLPVEPLAVDQQEGQLDLTLELLETDSTITGICRYNTDLFERGTVERLLTHYQVLLDEIVRNPSARISTLRMVTDAELAVLLHDWPTGSIDTSPMPFFPDVVTSWSRVTPDAIALEFQNERITWREMERQVARLAAYLQARDMERDTIVALYLDRSPRLAIAILAVMRAGGAYLALDPAYPRERTAFMLNDSGASLVLSESSLSAALAGSRIEVIVLDTLVAPDTYTSLPARIVGDQPAYIIYTSGSTGKPKGVALNHFGLINVLRGQRDVLGLPSGRRVLQFASSSFDASVFEIVMALGNGGTLVLASRETLLPGPGLIDFIRRNAISVALLPPSTLAAMPYAELPELDFLMVGGEECSRELVERWAPGRRFFNLYGPSEVTIWATAARCFPGSEKPSIGRPVTNVRVYLLDPEMHPVPCGVPGELWVGGPGVASGYLNRPALTAERFVPDPFGASGAMTSPGDRLYRSGDRARWRPDGSLEYLGRGDDQVKLRGYRIELGEIEAVLREHPDIADAAVIVRGAQLAAYVVFAQKQAELDSVFAHLRERLPDYMRPVTVTPVHSFPLSPGGKVDKRALPDPVAALEYIAPRNEREMQLCSIFSEVLQLPRCGIHDDFFAYGGHSLNALQLLARVRDATGDELPLRSLFENSTPARLAAQMAREPGTATRLPALLPAPPEMRPVLSFAQERLWFLHQLRPESPAFNIPAALRIRGVLDVRAVEHALEQIAARHTVLRTSFQTVDGRPSQSVQESVRFCLLPPEHDLARAAAEEAYRPIDLSSGSPMRARLVELAEDDRVLLVTVHHIASDGWSTGLFLREFASLYNSKRSGLASVLPPLGIQYADYARWQRTWLGGELLGTQLEFWKQRLSSLASEEVLPNRPRTSAPSARAGVCRFRLDGELTARAREFSRSCGVTLYMTLLAAFHAVLGRYTGSDDVVCGSPVANRNHTGTEDVIGFFVNMLVMRGDLSGNPSFRELVAREKDAVLGAFAHQDVPFELLVDVLHPKRDLSRSPIFQNTFALHNAPMEIPHIPGLELETVEDIPRTARYEIEFHLSETGSAIDAFALYLSELFDGSFVEGFTGAFKTLLRAALSRPDEPLANLEMVPDEVRDSILTAGNGLAPLPVFESSCLHWLVECQANRDPQREAVRYENEAITYGDLDAMANRLANLLIERGIGPGSLVGLFMERSADLISGMLAILKSGAAYVPLDPAYPGERLAFILRDAQIGTIVTQEALLDRLPQDVESICFDRDRSRIALYSSKRPGSAVQPHDTAYVIYTSGSTGQPKGVLVTHANVTRIFGATRPWFHFDEHDVWTMFHSSAFDFSVWEIWGALVHGGRLVIVPYATSRTPEAFLKLIQEEGVTVLNQTPSAFRQFQHTVLASAPATLPLRLVIFGGEALDFRGLAPWFEKFGDRRPRLVNMYGITETTIHVTIRAIEAADTGSGSSLIGHPLPDLRLYVLDANGRLVPPGVPGEVFVGGAGVAGGYLNRPEMTRQRFVPNLFVRGETLYRSGDRARFTGTGDIEYLGRLDRQVQLHGFRVELGEIEAALESAPSVRDAVARLWEERIVAWIVPSTGLECNASELRSHLRKSLPDYMIPSVFLPVAALPLNANGKIEYRDLPSPTAARPQLDVAFAAPQREEERILAAIWAEVLGIERPGIHDNFFELGGDSILSIQIVSKAAAAGLGLNPRQIFQHQTVAELAAVAAPLANAFAAAAQLPVTGEYPLTRIQRWFLAQNLANPHQWNQSVVLTLAGNVDNTVLENACRKILEHHDILRTRVEGGRAWVGEPDGSSSFACMDLAGDPDPEARLQAEAAAVQESLHLETGPLIRFARFKTGGDAPDRLLIVAHHLVIDGVSWRILLEDLAAILDGRDLPPKTASFSEWASGEAGHADYPTQVGAAENTESTARAVSAVLTVEETRDLLTRLPMIAGCRVDDILLAAAAGAMSRVVVNLENHGRGLTGLDVSRTVGWFTAFRTVSLDVPAGLSPGRLLETVCEQATRDSEPTVAPRVSLNYLGQFDRPVPSGSPFSLTRERLGSERSPQNRRPHEVDIAAAVFAGQMHIEWIYSSALCERSVAERQAERFLGTLRALIMHYVRSGVPAEATDVYPLAPQQQGMLLESLVGASSGVHVEQLTCRLEGPLDADRFRSAWASVIARHSVLRTCFLWRGRTKPLQVVYNSVELPVETGIWESDNLDAYLDAERRRGFQLDRAPLMRLGLFRLTDHSHRFVWTQHHAILDGWCQPLVLGEVLRTYRDGSTEEDAPEYGHYLAYIKRQDLAACESFWRSQLEGFRTPTSPGRLCSESEKIAWPETFQTADVTLDHGLTVELEDAARAGHVSLSTLVTGAWALLLARYSGSDDVLFGLTVAGRPADLSGAGKIVGLMANTLPLRIRIQDEAPIWSWIGEVGQAQAGIRMYETSPPDSVRRSSQVPAAMPLHDSVLVFENYPVEALSKNTAGLGFTIQEIAFHGARTQQTVAIIAVPGHQLSLRFVFDRRRIDPGSIPGDFRSVLEAIAHASQASAVADITNGLDAAQFPRVFPVARHRPVATETRDGRQATSVERRLTELWRGILDIPSLGLDDNFFDIGGHSLIAIDLLTRIRGEFGRDLPLSAIVEAPTVSALARLLEDDSAYRRGPLIALSGQGSRRPVCFLPGAGGNVLYFDALARLLHPDQPFFAIEARGLNGEDEILTDVEEIAAYNIEVLRHRFPRGPYLLGGHSFGCMVSLEMALQLQRQGQTVDRLFILDDMAPVPGRIAPDDLQEDIDAVWLYKILRLAERLQRRTMGLQITDLLPLSAEGQLDLAMSKLKEIDYLPGGTERASAHRYVQLFKANFRASFRYVARERFRGQLVLFRARDQQPHDPIVAYSRNFIDDPQWGWGRVCETVDVHWVPGDHISMMTEPNVRELAAQLARHLVS